MIFQKIMRHLLVSQGPPGLEMAMLLFPSTPLPSSDKNSPCIPSYCMCTCFCNFRGVVVVGVANCGSSAMFLLVGGMSSVHCPEHRDCLYLGG